MIAPSRGASVLALMLAVVACNSGGERRDGISVCLIVPSAENRDPLVDALMTGGIHAFVTLQEGEFAQVEWLREETDGTGIGAERAFLRCYDRGAPVVVGPFAPRDVEPVVRVANEHDVILVVPMPGGLPVLRIEPNVFAIAPPVESMGSVAAADARQRCAEHPCAVLHLDGTYGEAIADAFIDSSSLRDPPVRHALSPSAQRWTEAALDLGRDGIRGLLLVGEVEHAEAVLTQLDGPELRQTVVWISESGFALEVLHLIPAGAEDRVRVLRAGEAADRTLQTEYLDRWQTPLGAPAVAGYEALRIGALLAQQTQLRDSSSRAAWLRRRSLSGSAFGPTHFASFKGLPFEESAGFRVFDVVRRTPAAVPGLLPRGASTPPASQSVEP